MGNLDWRNHDNQKVDAPVHDVRCRGTLGANPKWIDFSSIQPTHGEVRGAEEGDVQNETSKCDDHRDHLTETADEEEFAAAT